MKKLIWGSALLILVACQCKPKQESTAVAGAPAASAAQSVIMTKGSTLDGLSIAQAHQWVSNFRDDATTSNNITSVWFSSYWIRQTRLLLDKEANIKVDGFRLYFAKNDAGQNTLVVLATKNIGSLPSNITINAHADFFDHAVPSYIRGNTANADITEEYTADDGMLFRKPIPPGSTEGCSITETNHVISRVDANRYVGNFNSKPINIRSVWYPTKMIDNLDEELKAAVAKGIKADGVRVYFARDDRGNNMLVLATTQTIKDSAGKTYHRDNPDCYTQDNLESKSGAVPWYGGYDRGEKCPNFCDGEDLPCDTCSTGGDKSNLINPNPAKVKQKK